MKRRMPWTVYVDENEAEESSGSGGRGRGGDGGRERGGGRRGYVFQVQCRFTSTVTIRIIRDGGALDVHLDFHTAPELLLLLFIAFILLYSPPSRRLAALHVHVCLFLVYGGLFLGKIKRTGSSKRDALQLCDMTVFFPLLRLSLLFFIITRLKPQFVYHTTSLC